MKDNYKTNHQIFILSDEEGANTPKCSPEVIVFDFRAALNILCDAEAYFIISVEGMQLIPMLRIS